MIASLLLALGLAASVATGGAPRLALDARVVWTEDRPGFGGFSAIDMTDGGAGFLAISDRGSWARGRIERDSDGRMTGVSLASFGALRAIDGDRLGRNERDAEGLAVDAAGAAYVSFEGFHRVRRYHDMDSPPKPVKRHPAFRGLQDNAGLEALAIDEAGVLHAIPERSGRLDRPFPVWRHKDGRWLEPLSLPRRGPWQISGADFGPDRRLYVLERDFSWTGGFATRIRSFAVAPDGFTDEQTLIETGLGSTDNYEGISVWRDPAGAIRITLIADDNFFPLQSTAVAEYLLAGG